MRWLRKEFGISRITLTGDSAGGNLATMAAVFACNEQALEKLKAVQYTGPDEDPFPEINGVLSMYGLLDRTSFFDKETEGISKLEIALSRFALDFIFGAYTGNEEFGHEVPQWKQPLQGRCTLCDWIGEMSEYPRTLLIVGSRDVLVHSSRKAHTMLQERGFKSTLLEYDARHAFIGLPPALNVGGTWRFHSKPATERAIQFFDELSWSEESERPQV